MVGQESTPFPLYHKLKREKKFIEILKTVIWECNLIWKKV